MSWAVNYKPVVPVVVHVTKGDPRVGGAHVSPGHLQPLPSHLLYLLLRLLHLPPQLLLLLLFSCLLLLLFTEYSWAFEVPPKPAPHKKIHHWAPTFCQNFPRTSRFPPPVNTWASGDGPSVCVSAWAKHGPPPLPPASQLAPPGQQ